MNSKVYQQFIEETFEAMIPFQDETNNAYFFVEIPFIDTDKFNQFCLEHSFDLQLNYFEIQDIFLQSNDYVSTETHSIFQQSLQEFVEKHIVMAEPIPIKARYAVICIYTTPTNYRTMGILGSCFKKYGEEWKFYRFPLEEPTDEELNTFDGTSSLSFEP